MTDKLTPGCRSPGGLEQTQGVPSRRAGIPAAAAPEIRKRGHAGAPTDDARPAGANERNPGGSEKATRGI